MTKTRVGKERKGSDVTNQDLWDWLVKLNVNVIM